MGKWKHVNHLHSKTQKLKNGWVNGTPRKGLNSSALGNAIVAT